MRALLVRWIRLPIAGGATRWHVPAGRTTFVDLARVSSTVAGHAGHEGDDGQDDADHVACRGGRIAAPFVYGANVASAVLVNLASFSGLTFWAMPPAAIHGSFAEHRVEPLVTAVGHLVLRHDFSRAVAPWYCTPPRLGITPPTDAIEVDGAAPAHPALRAGAAAAVHRRLFPVPDAIVASCVRRARRRLRRRPCRRRGALRLR